MSNKSIQTPKPNKEVEYKTLKSAVFIGVIAAIVMVLGLILLAVALFGKVEETFRSLDLAYGVSCIVVSSLLFVISNLASDVHLLTYTMQEFTLSNMDNSSYVLSHLRDIEEKLDAIKDSTPSGNKPIPKE